MVKKFQSTIIIGFFLIVPLVSVGQTTPQVSLQALIEQLQEQIKVLQEQVTSLQTQLTTTKEEVKTTREEVAEVKAELKITRSLQRGAIGDEVRELQEFLKKFPDIYPSGLVTGYFGPQTEVAVKKLQEKQGIEAIGIVGPKTLTRLNALFAEGAGASGVIPPGLLTAPGIQKKLTPLMPPQATSTTT
ncbi:MAG: peptidoglycan-binding domain-containing protein, partial [Patescibacteria group bacterium]